MMNKSKRERLGEIETRGPIHENGLAVVGNFDWLIAELKAAWAREERTVQIFKRTTRNLGRMLSADNQFMAVRSFTDRTGQRIWEFSKKKLYASHHQLQKYINAFDTHGGLDKEDEAAMKEGEE